MEGRAAVVLVLAWLVAGCSDDSPSAMLVDAGMGDAAVSRGPPDISWLAEGVPTIAPPALTPCPPGWREVSPASPDDVATCDPYPEGGALDCPPGQAHFPGEPGCASIGTACPAGDWADGLPATGVRYVRVGAAAGGDGSMAAPHARIADALAGAPAGTTIAIAKGRYDEVVSLGPGLTIVGACAAETVIAPRTIGSALAALTAARPGSVTVRDVAVSGSPAFGVRVFGSSTSLVLEGVAVLSATGAGIVASGGGHLDAQSVVVNDTRSRADGRFGFGLQADDSSMVQVQRALIDDNHAVAVFATGGSTVGLTDVVLRDTVPEADGTAGIGLYVDEGSQVSATRVLSDHNSDLGFFAGDVDTLLVLTDFIVRDTESRMNDGLAGKGLSVQSGATVEGTRGLFERNRDVGAYASDAMTSVTLADMVVRDTIPRASDGTGGRALAAQFGASLTVTRALLARNRYVCASATDPDTTVTLSDVVVRDTTAADGDGTSGRGMGVQEGAAVIVTRALFERNREVGIFVGDMGTSLALEDVVVRDTESRESDGELGRGLSVQRGATVEARRTLFARNRELGILVGGASTRVTLEEVSVRETRLPACASSSCMRPSVGIGSYDGAQVDVRGFAVDGSELCGVQVSIDGALDLQRGVVRHSAVGACVQVDGYDINRLNDDVAYVDNGVNLQATTFPLPELAALGP